MSCIRKTVVDEIVNHFKDASINISESTMLVEDLHADSFDFVEIAFELETRFNVIIPDNLDMSTLRTVEDVVIMMETIVSQSTTQKEKTLEVVGA